MDPEPGISRALAQARASRVSGLRCALDLSIPEDAAAPVRAHAVISFALAQALTPLVLDFAPNAPGQIRSCACNGTAAPPVVSNGHIVIPADALRDGINTIRFEFDAGDAPLNRRDGYLYTILVPARAHEVFPCFDQPDLKTRWTLTLDLPGSWTAVANAAETSRHSRVDPDGAERIAVAFAETDPLPTYLFAFAAGRFSFDVGRRDGREMRIFHLEPDSERLRSNRDAILDPHADALRWLETYTALAYPFGKFDIVLLPAFQFGGMEHPGAVFYNADALLLPPSATRQQLLARANVIAHETAHMWFGDLVTMTWFDDVWMKEVFANFMAAKIVNPQFPDLDHELRFLHAHYPAAYDVDRTGGSNAIRQQLTNLADAGSLYGAIVYLKSPIVMRQLELLVGGESLRDALRTYLARYRFGNATWPDLIRVLAERSAVDVAGWSRDWIDEPGRPRVSTELEIVGGTVSSLALRTSDFVPGRGLTWPQHLDIALGYADRVKHSRAWLDGALDLAHLEGTPAPDYVLPNGGGLGYGEFHLDARSREWLVRHLPDVPDAVTRGSAWLTLWDGMLCEEIPPDMLLDLCVRCLPREDSELNLQRILAYLERLFWTFLQPASRVSCAGSVERVLQAAMQVASATTAKAALFACLRATTTTDAGVGWLRALWLGESHIEGLPLGEADRIAIAQELAVRPGASGDAIVQRQLEQTASPDRRATLAFIAPALSADVRERERFFTVIADAANRRREPWVIEGMRWLHHPLRAESALRFLEPGLQLLEEVKRTGDIFLPRRWLDAMLGGHRSPEAAAIVRAFVESRPADYHPALKRMVIASADYLFRAARPGSYPTVNGAVTDVVPHSRRSVAPDGVSSM